MIPQILQEAMHLWIYHQVGRRVSFLFHLVFELSHCVHLFLFEPYNYVLFPMAQEHFCSVTNMVEDKMSAPGHLRWWVDPIASSSASSSSLFGWLQFTSRFAWSWYCWLRCRPSCLLWLCWQCLCRAFQNASSSMSFLALLGYPWIDPGFLFPMCPGSNLEGSSGLMQQLDGFFQSSLRTSQHRSVHFLALFRSYFYTPTICWKSWQTELWYHPCLWKLKHWCGVR